VPEQPHAKTAMPRATEGLSAGGSHCFDMAFEPCETESLQGIQERTHNERLESYHALERAEKHCSRSVSSQSNTQIAQ